jgi:tRNA 2-thiouridine synthesizing protein A
MIDKTVDARGLSCPLPILRAKKALTEIPVGGALEILTTDKGSVADFEAFARATGNELMVSELASAQAAEAFRFVIRKLA